MNIKNLSALPDSPEKDTVYRLIPTNQNQNFYDERTDRNLGILTKKDQADLKGKTIGIAGCGGMGGYLASLFVRLGVGKIKLADPENFDISNLNRQFGANKYTIGKSKSMETARICRLITTDMEIDVYPMGINKYSVEDFVSDCDIIIDEIEFWELEAPIILHRASRIRKIPVLGCNTAGFGTHLFLFTSDSMPIEDVFGVSRDEAHILDKQRRSGEMDEKKMHDLLERMLLVIAPELKNTHTEEFPRIKKRLLEEGKASIISTNPAFATGFLADRILCELIPRLYSNTNVHIPKMPGYAYMDARLVIGKIVTEKWW